MPICQQYDITSRENPEVCLLSLRMAEDSSGVSNAWPTGQIQPLEGLECGSQAVNCILLPFLILQLRLSFRFTKSFSYGGVAGFSL